jgi:hypothetical protein
MAKFKRGTDVGIFAQELFPGGIDCKPKSPSQYRKSVERTATVISENSHDVIYEAAFQYDRVLILLDILAKQNGKWNAFEVKSSLKISDTYLLDAALQYYVLINSGIEIDNFYLVHLNPDYVFENKLEIDQLFTFVDVTAEIAEKQVFIKEHIAAEKEAIALKKSPPINIGVQCNNPYPCDFIGHCWKQVPKNSVFEMVFLAEEEKFELFHGGQKTIGDLNPDHFKDEKVKNEIVCRQQEQTFFNADRFQRLIQDLDEPFLFVGFLGNRVALPGWKNYRPYDMVPLGMSAIAGDIAPDPFFNPDSERNPDEAFISYLKNLIGGAGTIFIYEGERFLLLLEQMKRRNPRHEELIKAYANKVVDLKDLMRDFIYFNPLVSPEMNFSDLQKILSAQEESQPPFYSDALAIHAYTKQPPNDMISEDIIAFTTWRADMANRFFLHLISKPNHG